MNKYNKGPRRREDILGREQNYIHKNNDTLATDRVIKTVASL